MNEAGQSSESASPIDTKTFAIGILSVTACILFVGFILVTMTPSTAFGQGMVDRSGDYIMVTEQISNSIEAIAVIDAAVKQINLYGLNGSTGDLRILQRIKLDRLPGSVERRERKRGP